MKYKQASIVLAFFVAGVFLSCTEQESASPQEIAAAEIAEEASLPVIQQASVEAANSPAVYQASVEVTAEQVSAVFPELVHYFQPLAPDETLATLNLDFPLVQILAISQERNTYRVIHKLTGVPPFSNFQFSDDRRSGIVRRGDFVVPLYHIDGETGVVSYLFESASNTRLSYDGRFIAFSPVFQQTSRDTTVALFSVEEGNVIAQFSITRGGGFVLAIRQEDRSNFRVFNVIGEWGMYNAEGVLCTENLTFQMDEISGFVPALNQEDMLAVRLNNFPRLRHSLNIELPLPAPRRSLTASELVNVYSEPDFSSEVIQRVGRLPFGQAGYYFMLYEIGDEAVFEGISSHWAYVRVWQSDGQEGWRTDTTGWVFLGLMIY